MHMKPLNRVQIALDQPLRYSSTILGGRYISWDKVPALIVGPAELRAGSSIGKNTLSLKPRSLSSVAPYAATSNVR
jgi:hypothetical protein